MIENNNEPISLSRTPTGFTEEDESSRRNSASSQLSSSTTSPTYDSGNISDLNVGLRPASLSSAEDDSLSNDYGQQSKVQHLLREKDQSLFLALQDVRKLKSELERLSKSEKWYKSELRSQKNSRMEILEKLYTNERKFTQENQRLQNECIALYARCSEMENQLQEEKALARELVKSSSKAEVAVSDGVFSRDFELEQHRQRLSDQEELIEMLRNQKRNLLKDLQRLSSEKDEAVVHMQKNIAQLDDENRTITKRCLQLVEAKIVLQDELLTKETECNSMSNEVLDLQMIVKSLQEKLHSHVADLNQKECEINSLRHELALREHSDELSELLQRKHQLELSEKQDSICSLNDTISSLKVEITSLEDLRTRHEDQKRAIGKLEFLLSERTSELENLRRLGQAISSQSEVQIETAKKHSKEENEKLSQQNLGLRKELNSIECKCESLELDLENTKQELKQLSEKYLEVCKLYEKSKFDLDMKDITVEKLKFEKEKDTTEIGTLREKLVEMSKKLECQRSSVTEIEFALSRTQLEKRRLEAENKCNIDRSAKLKLEASQSAENSNGKDVEIERLRIQLSKLEDVLTEHNSKANSKDAAMLLHEKNSSESRVALIQRLIELQSDKVKQLNAEQQDWENLLTVISSEHNPIEIDEEPNEFENLNHLFDDQNLQLIQINEDYRRQSLKLEQDLETTKKANKTFHQELEIAKLKIISLEKQVEALESVNVDYQQEIADLAGANERIIQEFNKDFSHERENHKKQTKQLKLEVKRLTTESDELRNKVQLLESEVDQLHASEHKSSQNHLETCDTDCQKNESMKNVSQDRILQNVLETEHRRKMNRYDVHIRSLLSNIKSYKKNLEIAENRYEALLVKSKEMVEIEEFRAVETNLQNMRVQFESSQREVNNLKHQLKTIKEEFYVTDASKGSSTMDMTNLMDDYKKLIQQSQAATKRPSTSEIYKLINKSNNFVPKLTNISASVDGLREDIQQMCTAMNLSSPAGRGGSPQIKLSLMDELKLAEHEKLC